jgi:hypothetical protein
MASALLPILCAVSSHIAVCYIGSWRLVISLSMACHFSTPLSCRLLAQQLAPVVAHSLTLL